MSINRDNPTGPLTERRELISRGEVAAQSSLLRPAPESPRFSSRSSNGLERSVELHIEELVLDGFEAAYGHTIGDAVQRELTRLFREEGTPIAITQDRDIANLVPRTIEISEGSNSEVMGAQLANEIYTGLTQ